MQEFRTGATRQSMEAEHAKEEVKRLRDSMNEIRGKLADLQSKYNQLNDKYCEEKRLWEAAESEWAKEKVELQSCITRQQEELDAIMAEVQHLVDAKLSLELEIAAYRKLLEGEETRIGLRDALDDVLGGGDKDASAVKGGEMSAKTTYQKSAKGPIGICEASADGKFITLENNSRVDEDIGSWKIKRVVKGKR